MQQILRYLGDFSREKSRMIYLTCDCCGICWVGDSNTRECVRCDNDQMVDVAYLTMEVE